MLGSRQAHATVLTNSHERFLSGREPRVNGGRPESSRDTAHGLNNRDFLSFHVLDNPFHKAILFRDQQKDVLLSHFGRERIPGHLSRPPTKRVENQLRRQHWGQTWQHEPGSCWCPAHFGNRILLLNDDAQVVRRRVPHWDQQEHPSLHTHAVMEVHL